MSSGTCMNCKTVLTPGKMPKHLKECILGEGQGKKHKKFLLKVTGEGEHWMYLRMDGSATLEQLDSLLRDEWLECCGHLSTFDIGGLHYEAKVADWEDAPYKIMNIKTKAHQILAKGLKFSHEYDFGTTTTLRLAVRDEYFDDKPAKKPVEMLARNNIHEYTCGICGGKGANICQRCMEEKGNPFLCKKCSDEHEDEDEEHYLLPIVNSPRMGMCGYTG